MLSCRTRLHRRSTRLHLDVLEMKYHESQVLVDHGNERIDFQLSTGFRASHHHLTRISSPRLTPNFSAALPLTTAIAKFPVLPISAMTSPTGRSPKVLTRP